MRWPGGLWRHRDFRNLWAAETISQFGSQIDDLALAARRDHRARRERVRGRACSARRSSSRSSCSRFLRASGSIGCRESRSSSSAISGASRCSLTIPIAYVCDVADAVAAVRGRVPRRRLHRLLRRRVPVVPAFARRSRPARRGQLEARDQPLGLTARRAWARRRGRRGRSPLRCRARRRHQLPRVGDCSCFAIRKREERSPTATSTRRSRACGAELKEGLRFVLRNPNLRAISVCTATSNFFSSVACAIFVVYAVREVEMSPGVLGLVFSVGSVGPLRRRVHDEQDLRPASASARRRSS